MVLESCSENAPSQFISRIPVRLWMFRFGCVDSSARGFNFLWLIWNSPNSRKTKGGAESWPRLRVSNWIQSKQSVMLAPCSRFLLLWYESSITVVGSERKQREQVSSGLSLPSVLAWALGYVCVSLSPTDIVVNVFLVCTH